MCSGAVLSDCGHAQLAAVGKPECKGGWEVGHGRCFMPGLTLGDLGQVPSHPLLITILKGGVRIA